MAILRGLIGIAVMAFLLGWSPAGAETIKDIVEVEGFRENKIIGYGLVIGLNGTGDKTTATKKAIANMLQRLGVTVRPADINTKNSAAVVVTASLPPYPKPGMRVDALVSSIADAKSLQGGTLLLTPLKGPDGKVYALAQGPVSVGGFVGGKGGATVQKNHPTVGRIPNGVIIEREPPFEVDINRVRLFLKEPDFSLATRIARRINEAIGAGFAKATDPATVTLRIPDEYMDSPVEFISMVEGLDIQVEPQARVIINERTGTVVIGEKVKLRPVAISHGSLTIEIRTEYAVSQPPSFAPGSAETVVVPESETVVKEQEASVVELSGATLGEIIKALNTLGVSPRDLIAILQALKAAGALRAELQII